MNYLLFVSLLLASCSSAPKVYSKPEIGMDYVAFDRLCGYGLRDERNTETNTKGTTLTVVLRSNDNDVIHGDNASSNRSDKECVGKFMFINGKLDSISR